MFSNDDYINYFSELEHIVVQNITVYTDLMNVVDTKSILSKLHASALDDSEAFKFIRRQKEIFREANK